MPKFLLIAAVLILLAVPVLAETPSPVRTPDPRQSIDLTATQILAEYTATAEAFPVAPEQVDEYSGFVFMIVMGSMLVVLIPLAFGFWRINRSK